MSAAFKGERKCVKFVFIQMFCNWKCKHTIRVAVDMRHLYKQLWELVSRASTALRHRWGEMGDCGSGSIFQSHRRSSDKMNLSWSSLIFISALSLRETQLRVQSVGHISWRVGKFGSRALTWPYWWLKIPFDGGRSFSPRLFFTILLNLQRVSYSCSHLLSSLPCSCCRQDLLAGGAG